MLPSSRRQVTRPRTPLPRYWRPRHASPLPICWEETWLHKVPKSQLLPSGALDVNGVQGFLLPGDVEYLFQFTAGLPAGGTLVEVGSYLGLSTIFMATSLLQQGNFDARFFCVDTWEGSPEMMVMDAFHHRTAYHIFCDNVQRAQVAPLIRPIRMPSVQAAALFPQASVDRMFLDGDHSEEGCYADLTAWWDKIRPGGRLCGHDCRPDGGVRPALTRFAAERGLTYSLVEPPKAHYIFEMSR